MQIFEFTRPRAASGAQGTAFAVPRVAMYVAFATLLFDQLIR